MVKFKIIRVEICSIFMLLFITLGYAQQNESLRVQLWQRVLNEDDLTGYSVQEFLDNKGWEEWDEGADNMNSNVLVDDSKNGFLQLNRDYLKVTVGAFKDKNGNYTILENRKLRYYNRSITSNKLIKHVLPKGFGISDFISDTTAISGITHSCFYLEADIPRKGTDIQLNIKLIPFGLLKKGSALTYSITEYDGDNIFLYEFLHVFIKEIKDNKTLSQLVDKKFENISIRDKRVIDNFIGEEGESQFENIEELSELLVYLNNVHQLNSAITYESVILGWNRDDGRFFIKNRIENDAEKLSFKAFLETSEYYMAIQ